MRKTGILISFIAFSTMLFAQKDFNLSTKFGNSFVAAYYTFQAKSNSYYTTTTEYRYGLYNEKTKKFILPMQYKTLIDAKIDHILIVQDTLKRYGLYDMQSNKFMVEFKYKFISTFKENMAIVTKDDEQGKTKYGVIDKNGKILVPLEYTYLGEIGDGLICFSQDRKYYGYIDKNNKTIIAPKYRSVTTFSSGLACVSLVDSLKYGYINKQDKWIAEPTFLSGETFKGNFAIVSNPKNYDLDSKSKGVIDKTGKIIVPLKYDEISFTDNYFIVAEKKKESYLTTSRYGILDHQGKAVLPVEYNNITNKYGTNFIEVQKNYKYNLYDQNLLKRTTVDYDYIYTFSNELSYLRKDKYYTIVDKNLKVIVPEQLAENIVFGTKDKVAVIRKEEVKIYTQQGKLIKTLAIPNITQYGTSFFNSDDSIKITNSSSTYLYDILTKKMKILEYTEVGDFNEDGIFIGKKSNYDFCDINGEKLNAKTYTSIREFSEGIAIVQESTYSTPYLVDRNFAKISNITDTYEGPFKEGLAKAKATYGNTRYYYNKQGKYAITISNATEATDFKYGRATIKDLSTAKFYYIDKSGNKINEMKYDYAGDFSDGLAVVKNGNKYGFIDTTGKTIIDFKYDAVSPFYSGYAMVKNGNEFYVINKKDKRTSEVYNNAINPNNATFPVQKGTNYGLIDGNGNVLIDFKYQEISSLNEGVAWAKKNGKWALISKNGNELTDFKYETIGNCKNGYLNAGFSNKNGLLDKNGKQILPIKYSQMGNVFNNKLLLQITGGAENYSTK